MCARRSDLRRIGEVAALEGAAAFGSVWLAQFRERATIDSVMVGDFEVTLPKLTEAGIDGELTDPALAMMAIHECACIAPEIAAILRDEWELRRKAME